MQPVLRTLGGRYMFSFDEVKNYDPEIAAAMNDELKRQQDHIELIASENIVSKAVMSAMGSILTNKYAEGYPGKRYYGGCEYVDVVETLAIERAKKLFGCEYANVQPHSGAQANLAAFFAMVEPGDTVMGMSLDCGGHLSHGSPVNISGKYFNIVPYGVTAEGFIDYDEVLRIAKECKPKMIIAGASILGLFMMGGLASTYVTVTTPLKIATSTYTTTIQSIFDSILPGILPLVVVLLVWKYLSKSRNYFKATIGLTIASLVLGCIGVII